MTPRQRRFVDEYLIDLVATKAAIRAGYSEKTAGAIGGENLKKPEIRIAITERMNDRAQRTGITQDKVLADLEAIKQSAMSKAKDKDGNLLMASHTAALRALELQGRHLGLWKERAAVTGGISIADAIRQRVAERTAREASLAARPVASDRVQIGELAAPTPRTASPRVCAGVPSSD